MPIPVNPGFYLAMAVFLTDAADDEGGFVNTWYFEDEGGPRTVDLVADDIEEWLNVFYTSVNAPATKTVTQLMSPVCDVSNATIRVYDLGEAAPRTPTIRGLAMTTPQSSSALPNEVAACLSFHSATPTTGGGTLNKRKRGRVYLGPFGTGALASWTAGDGDAFLHADLIAAVKNSIIAADALTSDVEWQQYSRASNDFEPVTQCFIDNRFDTQRRRGFAPSSRTIWTP